MPFFTRNEKILLRSSERKDLLVEKYIDEINKLYIEEEGDGSGKRTRQSSGSSMMYSVFEKDRDRRVDGGEEVERSLPRDTHWYETKVEFRGIKVPIRIPMTPFAEDVGEVSEIPLWLLVRYRWMLMIVLDSRTCSNILDSHTLSTAIPSSTPYKWPKYPPGNINPERNVGAQTSTLSRSRSTSQQRSSNGPSSMRNGIRMRPSPKRNHRICIPICQSCLFGYLGGIRRICSWSS